MGRERRLQMLFLKTATLAFNKEERIKRGGRLKGIEYTSCKNVNVMSIDSLQSITSIQSSLS